MRARLLFQSGLLSLSTPCLRPRCCLCTQELELDKLSFFLTYYSIFLNWPLNYVTATKTLTMTFSVLNKVWQERKSFLLLLMMAAQGATFKRHLPSLATDIHEIASTPVDQTAARKKLLHLKCHWLSKMVRSKAHQGLQLWTVVHKVLKVKSTVLLWKPLHCWFKIVVSGNMYTLAQRILLRNQCLVSISQLIDNIREMVCGNVCVEGTCTLVHH